MGFCGCSLYASTVSAGVYGIVFSLYGISWASAVINAMNSGLRIMSLITYAGYDLSLSDVSFLGYDRTLFSLVVLTLVLHLAWLLSSIAVLIGNENKNKATLHVWVALVSIILVADIASELYCFLKPDNCSILDLSRELLLTGICRGYLLVGIFFAKFGLITIGIQVSLAIYVTNRAKEMQRELQGPQQTMIITPAAQFVVAAGPGVSTQYLPFQQTPYQPVQQEVGYGWREPAPDYSPAGVNRTDGFPQKGDHRGTRY